MTSGARVDISGGYRYGGSPYAVIKIKPKNLPGKQHEPGGVLLIGDKTFCYLSTVASRGGGNFGKLSIKNAIYTLRRPVDYTPKKSGIWQKDISSLTHLQFAVYPHISTTTNTQPTNNNTQPTTQQTRKEFKP